MRLKSKIFGADATFLFRKKTFLEFSAASEIFVLWWIDGVVWYGFSKKCPAKIEIDSVRELKT